MQGVENDIWSFAEAEVGAKLLRELLGYSQLLAGPDLPAERELRALEAFLGSLRAPIAADDKWLQSP